MTWLGDLLVREDSLRQRKSAVDLRHRMHTHTGHLLDGLAAFFFWPREAIFGWATEFGAEKKDFFFNFDGELQLSLFHQRPRGALQARSELGDILQVAPR